MLNIRMIQFQVRRYIHLGVSAHHPRFRSNIDFEEVNKESDNDGFEIHHSTRFGSIRLDSQNSPKQKPLSSVDTMSYSSTMDPLSSSSPENSFPESRESIYFEEDVMDNTLSASKGFNISQNTAKGIKKPDLNDSSIGFIDEQYFGSLPSAASSMVVTEEPSIDCSESLKETRDLPAIKKKPEKMPLLKNKETALEFIKNRMKTVSPGDKYENASIHSKEKLVKDIGTSLQKRLMKVHDKIYEVPQSNKKIIVENVEREKEDVVPSVKGLKSKYKAINIYEMNSMEMEKMLQNSIIYNKDGIVALNKPYGLPMNYLEIPSGALTHVHRLDKTTTGVLLLSSTEESHSRLTNYFRQRKITKIYWAITNGVPEPSEGIIDIPIREEKINGHFRSMLIPRVNIPLKSRTRQFTSGHAQPAVSEYKVLNFNYNAALLEVNACTGFKHQIRAHLGFGLSTPILGDHKYSNIRGIGKPQKVNGEIILRLKTRLSKSRDIPLALHAREVIIPGVGGHSQDLRIIAGIPHYFSNLKSRLKL
ncbi:RPUSD4 [Lepeophtheirus salmonis]|uniref:Pseudouridylate synthase RPUSD4, mitochondrial n=1 Tax=Lepeophtheirus salmonis TaxID=72036 RepID=A0A7R8HDD2_LEPSM|nr:RPUSD4 [Lepeophtheirus salmonis]CAF3027679.1 RPUSD4 [Lepeophtheirus salmonis]